MLLRHGLLVLAGVGLFAGSAAASPASDKLFREGRELLKAGKIAEACEAFDGSQKLAAKVGTLLNLADCRERQGRTATAWSLFLEAKQLAVTQRDPRQAEAERRAAALQARLSFLTITVAVEHQVDGLVIKRNGVAIERAQWNAPIAVDPGDHVIEAAAPKRTPWSTTQALGVKQNAAVVVEALVAEPVADSANPDAGAGPAGTGERPGAPAIAVAAPRSGIPPVRPLAVGLVLGGTSDEDTVVGGRLAGGIAVPRGAVRAIASVLYTQYEDDPSDSDLKTKLFALGLSVDYVWMPLPQLAFGGGLGLGTDREVKNLDREGGSTSWWTLRASPVIVRVLQGRVEAGLHLQYVRTSERGVMLGLAAIDLFPL
jgi:hypothetical protein